MVNQREDLVKAVILAGGLGTRLAEETKSKPKPMVKVGEHPILLHIMKHYAHYDVKEFFVALGYKGEIIQRYFLDCYKLNDSMTISFSSGNVGPYSRDAKDWIVHLRDTGQETNT